MKYEDGSVASIFYFANGSKELPKEYMEIHFDGSSIVMDDYKSLKAFGVDVKEPKSKEFTSFEQIIENLIERFPMLERLFN